MIDRIVVERLLQACDQRTDIKVPVGPMLAELCRTWLAAQDAPVAIITGELELYALEPSDGDAYVAIGKLEGQRVRLVRDGGES